MKSDIKPSDLDLERTAKGRSPEELAELAARAKVDPGLARAIAELGGEPPPGAVTPLQGTPVTLNEEAAQVRRTVPRAGGHRLQQSAIPTRPRFEDLSGLHEYAGDAEGEGPAQELAPLPPSLRPGAVGPALPIEALREAAEAPREAAEARSGARGVGAHRGWIIAALACTLLVLVGGWYLLGGGERASGAQPGASAQPTVSAQPGVRAQPTSTAPVASTPPVASAQPAVTAQATASAEPAATAEPGLTAAPVVTEAPTTRPAPSAKPSAKPSATARPMPSTQPSATALPSGWNNQVAP
jgi:hypothetical protein